MNHAKSNPTSTARGKGRVETKVSRPLDRRLAAYSLAAAAAGVGITALAQDATHQTIQYTPADISFAGGLYDSTQPPIQIDLNHDGTVDFTLSGQGSGYYNRSQHISYYRGLALLYGSNGGMQLGRALTKGMWIGPEEKFLGGGGLFISSRFIHRNAHTYGHNHCVGPFRGTSASETEKYVGVAFTIQGQTHYGWIRLEAACSGIGTVSGTITGYAYDTVAGAPIQAGQIRSGENQADLKGTLGRLAAGSAGRN